MSKIASTAAHDDPHQSLPQSKFDSALSASARFSHRLHPKRNPHSWFALRLFLGIFGAALVLLPLALPQSWIASIFGLVIFLASILLPPALKSHGEGEPLREGSHEVILHGAEFCSTGAPVPVELFVSEEQILAMKSNLQPAVVIPTDELTSVFLQRSERSWLLFLLWSGKETAFAFHGHSAEHNAKKAEATIHNLGRYAPPEKAKARAAGA